MSASRSREPAGLGKLVGVLALFLVPGAACTVYLWHVLNDLLTGHPPGTGALLAGLGVLAALLALLRGLWYTLRQIGAGPA